MQIGGGLSVLTTPRYRLPGRIVRATAHISAGSLMKMDGYDETISPLSIGSDDRRYTYVDNWQ